MNPAAANTIPSTRPEDPIAILFLSDSGREGSVHTSVHIITIITNKFVSVIRGLFHMFYLIIGVSKYTIHKYNITVFYNCYDIFFNTFHNFPKLLPQLALQPAV